MCSLLAYRTPIANLPMKAATTGWWDYRTNAFARNMGWRIDHHYLSEDLYEIVESCTIDVEPRRWERPSDHAPVTVEYVA